MLLIGYDLNRPGQRYDDLIGFLMSEWHLVASSGLDLAGTHAAHRDADARRDQGVRRRQRRVLVLDATGDSWATFGISGKGNEWLKRRLGA